MLHATSSTFHIGGTAFGGEDSGENYGEDHEKILEKIQFPLR